MKSNEPESVEWLTGPFEDLLALQKESKKELKMIKNRELCYRSGSQP